MWSSATAIVLMLLWVPWRIWEDLAVYKAQPMRAVVGIGGIAGIMFCHGWWMWRKRGQLAGEEARILVLQEEFEELEGTSDRH